MKVEAELLIKTAGLKPTVKLNIDEKLAILQDIADLLMDRNLRAKDVMDKYGVSRPTAVEWLESAYKILERETHYTREGVRQVHRSQIERMINQLVDELVKTDDTALKLQIHDRLVKYYEQRARVNGLNTETIDVQHSMKPLQIIMPTEVIDGEIIPTPSQ